MSSFRSSGGPQPYSSTNLGTRPTPGTTTSTPLSSASSGAGAPGSGVNQSKRDLFFNNSSSPAVSLIQSINKNNINSMGIESNKNPTATNGTNGSSAANGSSSIGAGDTNNHHHVQNNVEKADKEKRGKSTAPSNKKTLDGYVGFSNLPNQIYRKAVKKGFDLCVMVVGSSGLGKSTLLNSLFLTDIYSGEYPGPSLRNKKTVEVESTKILLKENGVNLTLTIVDTPGFGDEVDNSNCWSPIISHIESRYEDYLNAESRVNRKQINDSRVHVCLYFIPPSGHGLRAIDIEFMKKLHDKVNLVPVIGKADTLTGEELAGFKKQILNQLTQQKVKTYTFPDCDDEEENKLNIQLRARVPFAVVGSNTMIDVDGKKVRGRKYAWGTVVVEDLAHNDFLALRNMILRTHLQDLKDVTNNVHYENYRCRKLAGIGEEKQEKKMTNGAEKNPLAQMEEEKKNHMQKMRKMESEMEQVFEMKVKERNQRLEDSEADLHRRSDQMRKSLEKTRMELEEKRRQFELDKANWEKENGVSVEELQKKMLEGKELLDGGKKPKKKSIF